MQDLRKFVVHIGRGLLKLHLAKITHGNFKPEDVFITKENTYKIGILIIFFVEFYFINR